MKMHPKKLPCTVIRLFWSFISNVSNTHNTHEAKSHEWLLFHWKMQIYVLQHQENLKKALLWICNIGPFWVESWRLASMVLGKGMEATMGVMGRTRLFWTEKKQTKNRPVRRRMSFLFHCMIALVLWIIMVIWVLAITRHLQKIHTMANGDNLMTIVLQ